MKSIIQELNIVLESVQYGSITREQLESSLETIIVELGEIEISETII